MKRLFCAVIISMLLACALNAQNSSRDFSKEQARASQDWIKDAVIYEIFPRQFSQKGDFNSITKDLDRLNKLGVTVLWLMPIHPIGNAKRKGALGSPYAAKDYFDVAPELGTKDDFKNLVKEAHKRGMKVILDVAANHTGWDSVMMKNPAYYSHNEKGEIIPPNPDWVDVADLNFDNPDTRKYMTEVFKYWVKEFDIDGYRCDVAGMIPTSFWEETRREVDKIKPDSIWLAEWHEPDLMVNAFNLDYAWAFHEAFDKALRGLAPAKGVRNSYEAERARFPKGTLHMRFSDNHDERRAIARFGERGALAAQALVFTMDGVPMLYNGMEVGDTTESGYPALFEKMPVFWDIAVRRPEFPKFYSAMTAFRKSHPSLRRGDTTWVKNSDEDRVLTFIRKTSGEELLVAINLSGAPFTGTVETKGLGKEVTPEEIRSKATNSMLPNLTLDPWGIRIFRLK